MNTEQKQRLRSILLKTIILLFIGFAYLLFIRITGWGIPCLIKLVTGKLCPGCGITRMIMALLRFDIKTAADNNILLLCLLPFFAVLGSYKLYEYVKKGECEMKLPEKVFYIVAFILCVAFWIMRNTETFSYLAP